MRTEPSVSLNLDIFLFCIEFGMCRSAVYFVYNLLILWNNFSWELKFLPHYSELNRFRGVTLRNIYRFYKRVAFNVSILYAFSLPTATYCMKFRNVTVELCML